MKIYFTSDTHLGHDNIIKYSKRPFSNAKDMDDYLIDQINRTVQKDDVLWHLGDFSMYSSRNREYYQQCQAYRNRIKCQNINIIWGNHDDFSIRSLFNKNYHYKEWRENNYPTIVMCHYALAIWNKLHRGSIHLYGHSHGSAENWLNQNMPGRRSIDVGVDYAKQILGEYRPWSIQELMSYFSDKKGFWFDHHI